MPDQSSKNTLQSNPANAGTDFEGWPDWNSARGVGQESPGEKASPKVFDEIYASTREGSHELEAQRLAENRAAGEPRKPAEITDADYKKDRSAE
jgi:hypothetical protein